MKRPFLFAGIFLLSLIALGILITVRKSNELAYQGKTVSTWSMQLYSPDPQVREQATNAFRQMGPSAVPRLVQLLHAKDPFFKQKLWSISSKFPKRTRAMLLRGTQPPNAATMQAAAARALGIIGPPASSTIDDLSEVLLKGESEARWEAAGALGCIGKDAVAPLFTGLRHKDPNVRQAAAFAVMQVGVDGKAAIPDLIKMLSDNNESVRTWAASALSSIGRPALPALLETVENGKGVARRSAAETLVKIYPSRRFAGAALLKLLSDEDPASRQQALKSLAFVHATDEVAMTAMSNTLKDQDPKVREVALEALAQLQAESAPQGNLQKP